MYELLDAIARANAGQDDRPMGALRADALVDICVSPLTEGHVDVTPMRADRRPRDDSGPSHEPAGHDGEPDLPWSEPDAEPAAPSKSDGDTAAEVTCVQPQSPPNPSLAPCPPLRKLSAVNMAR